MPNQFELVGRIRTVFETVGLQQMVGEVENALQRAQTAYNRARTAPTAQRGPLVAQAAGAYRQAENAAIAAHPEQAGELERAFSRVIDTINEEAPDLGKALERLTVNLSEAQRRLAQRVLAASPDAGFRLRGRQLIASDPEKARQALEGAGGLAGETTKAARGELTARRNLVAKLERLGAAVDAGVAVDAGLNAAVGQQIAAIKQGTAVEKVTTQATRKKGAAEAEVAATLKQAPGGPGRPGRPGAPVADGGDGPEEPPWWAAYRQAVADLTTALEARRQEIFNLVATEEAYRKGTLELMTLLQGEEGIKSQLAAADEGYIKTATATTISATSLQGVLKKRLAAEWLYIQGLADVAKAQLQARGMVAGHNAADAEYIDAVTMLAEAAVIQRQKLLETPGGQEVLKQTGVVGAKEGALQAQGIAEDDAAIQATADRIVADKTVAAKAEALAVQEQDLLDATVGLADLRQQLQAYAQTALAGERKYQENTAAILAAQTRLRTASLRLIVGSQAELDSLEDLKAIEARLAGALSLRLAGNQEYIGGQVARQAGRYDATLARRQGLLGDPHVQQTKGGLLVIGAQERAGQLAAASTQGLAEANVDLAQVRAAERATELELLSVLTDYIKDLARQSDALRATQIGKRAEQDPALRLEDRLQTDTISADLAEQIAGTERGVLNAERRKRATATKSAGVNERISVDEAAIAALVRAELADKKKQIAVDRERIRQRAIIAEGEGQPATRYQRFSAGLQQKAYGRPQDPLDQPTFGQQFTQRFSTSLQYGAAAISVRQLYQGITTMIEAAQALQDEFILLNLQLAEFGQEAQFDKVRDDLLGIARATGISSQDVLTVGRQIIGVYQDMPGGVQKGVKETGAAIRAAFVTGLPQKEIVDSLTAASLAYGTGIDEITDKAIGVEQRFGVLAKESLTFFGEIADTAHAVGLDLDELGAIVGVLQQKMGIAGSAISEQFGRVLSSIAEKSPQLLETFRITQSPELAAQLPDVAKAVGTGQSGRVLFEIAEGWDKISEAERNQIAVSIGGQRNFRTTTALFAGLNEQILAGTVYLDDSGKAMERQNALQKTLANQIARVKESLKQMADTLFRSGLGEFFTTLASSARVVLDVTNAVLGVFATLNKLSGGLVGQFLLLGGVVKALGLAFRLLAGSRVLATFTGLKTMLPSIIAQMRAARAASMGMGYGPAFGPGGPGGVGPAAGATGRIRGGIAAAGAGLGAIGLTPGVIALGAGLMVFSAIKTAQANAKEASVGLKETLNKALLAGDKERVKEVKQAAESNQNWATRLAPSFGIDTPKTAVKQTIKEFEEAKVTRRLNALKEQGIVSANRIKQLTNALDNGTISADDAQREINEELRGATKEQKAAYDKAIGEKDAAATEATLVAMSGGATQLANIRVADAQRLFELGQVGINVLIDNEKAQLAVVQSAIDAAGGRALNPDLAAQADQLQRDVNTHIDEAAKRESMAVAILESLGKATPVDKLEALIREFPKLSQPGKIAAIPGIIAALHEGQTYAATRAGDAEEGMAILKRGFVLADNIRELLLQQLRDAKVDPEIIAYMEKLLGAPIEASVADLQAQQDKILSQTQAKIRLKVAGSRDPLKQAKNARELAGAGLAAALNPVVDQKRIDDAQKAKDAADARVVSAQAMFDAGEKVFTGPPLDRALDAQTAANDKLADLLAEATPDVGKIADARAAVAEADASIAAAENADRIALLDLQRAKQGFGSNLLKDAKILIEKAKLAVAFARGQGTAAEAAAEILRLQAIQAEIDANFARGQAAIDLVIAWDQFKGNTVKAAQEGLKKLNNQLASELAKGSGTEVTDPIRAQIVTQQKAVIDAQIADQEEMINFQLEMGQITKGQAIAMYRGMLHLAANDKDRRALMLKIRALEKDVSSELQFNLGEIRIPTMYEARRLGQTSALGIGYNDNRNVTITMHNYNATDYQGSIDQFVNLANQPSRYGTYASIYPTRN